MKRPKGDPTPVCCRCEDYLTFGVHRLDLYDGRSMCMPCLAAQEGESITPTEQELARTLASIKKAGHG